VPKVSKRAASVFAGVAIAGAGALAAHFEGLRTTAYHDVVGVPTICYGHTKGVKMGDKATVAQCKAWLNSEMGDYYAIVKRCIRHPLTIGQAIAFTDATYNIGPKVVCGSTLQKLANAGHMDAACGELVRWNRAGGEIRSGLVVRRNYELQICMGMPVL
jgi:lysozyme